MREMNKIVALDFDGVICDSIIECALVGFNAYAKLFLQKEVYITAKEELPQIKLEKFRKLRPYIKKGWEYVIIHKIIEENIDISNWGEYLEFLSKFEGENIECIFYDERMKFKKFDSLKWFEANPIYPPILNSLRKTEKKLYIVTTKKKEFVLEILKNQEIEIREEKILTTFSNKSKKELLQEIAEKECVEVQEIIFVEDNVQSLIDVKDLGTVNYLAEWGYVNEEQLLTAKNENINTIKEDEFNKLLV